MKINVIVQANILKKAQKEFTDKNGKSVPYYQLVIDQFDNVDTFTCSKEVYDSVTVGKLCNLNAVIDTSADRARLKFTSVYENAK